MIITSASAKGSREYQEDRHIVKTLPSGAVLAAVFDGHGGDNAAVHCKQFVDLLNISDATLHPHLLLKQIMADLALLVKDYEQGCTASIVYIEPDFSVAHVAIVGDSPVIIFDDDMKLHRSPEHNVRSNSFERNAVFQRGGIIEGGYVFRHFGEQGLQLSRALGDRDLQPIVISEPEIYSVQLAPYSFVLVGSDGLFDPSHSDKTNYKSLGIIGTIHNGGDAQDLVNLAIESNTGDNVSAILIKKPFVAAFVSDENNRKDYFFKEYE